MHKVAVGAMFACGNRAFTPDVLAYSWSVVFRARAVLRRGFRSTTEVELSGIAVTHPGSTFTTILLNREEIVLRGRAGRQPIMVYQFCHATEASRLISRLRLRRLPYCTEYCLLLCTPYITWL